MGGYSIYASSLDGSDKCVRLEAYMADEHGGKDGWKIEKCYVKDDSNREMLDIIAGKFFIAYAPIESEKFLSMPKELARKYEEKFKYPERFYKSLDGIEAKPYRIAIIGDRNAVESSIENDTAEVRFTNRAKRLKKAV